MQQSSPPDLNLLISRLAADNTSVLAYMDSMSSRIEELVAKAVAGEWTEVQRLSGALKDDCQRHELPNLTDCVERVWDEARKPDNAAGIKKSLIRLVSFYGTGRTQGSPNAQQ